MIKLSDLLPCLPASTTHGPVDVLVGGIACDSRQVRPGALFVAIPGHAQDGMRFIADAVNRGAVAVVAEGDTSVLPGVCRVRVDDARLALARLAKAYSGNAADALELVGITGTNGKTTIAYLVRDLLAHSGRQAGLLSTVQYRIGERTIPASRTTPDPVVLHRLLADMRDAGCHSAVMEVSSHALAQKRVAGLDFRVAVFTNLSRDHLDYHQTMEAYFEAKMLLFAGLGGGEKVATAVLNADDPWGRRVAERLGARPARLLYGEARDADVAAEGLQLTAAGSSFVLRTPWGSTPVRIRLLGRHNVSNALGAAAAGLALGVPLDRVAEALAGAAGAPGRLQEVVSGRGFQVFVDYAHSDDALAHVLETVREVTSGRVILVFGCGGDRDTSKRPIMGAVAARLADRVVVTSDNPRREDPQAIIAQIVAGAPGAGHVEAIVDRREAIARALSQAGPGDLVLIAGKGHETFQEFASRTIAFDDAQVVRELLADARMP